MAVACANLVGRLMNFATRSRNIRLLKGTGIGLWLELQLGFGLGLSFSLVLGVPHK